MAKWGEIEAVIAKAGQDSVKSQLSTGGDGLPSIGARWSVLAHDIVAALEAAGYVIAPRWRVAPLAIEQYAGQPEMPRQCPGNGAQEPSP